MADFLAWVLRPPHLLLIEAIVLFVVWFWAALLIRTEYDPRKVEPRPVVFVLVLAGTAAFGLQVVTSIYPALSDELPIIEENLDFFRLMSGILRGIALVLLVAYISYRYGEHREH